MEKPKPHNRIIPAMRFFYCEIDMRATKELDIEVLDKIRDSLGTALRKTKKTAEYEEGYFDGILDIYILIKKEPSE